MDLVKEIRTLFAADKELIVNVMSALGREKVVSVKEKSGNWDIRFINMNHMTLYG